jgi:inhibitor of KinA sporulation pathway (predicted exonuclease)
MMGANLMKIFVVDLEATCWETPEEQGDHPNEIIEIGICELHIKSREVKGKYSYVVKPRYSKVSPFCTELTGWTQEAVDQGSDIENVLYNIECDYGITKNHVWASFGEYDRVKLSSDPEQLGGLSKLYNISRYANPFAKMRAHLNIKTLMALKEGLQKEMGMSRALNFYGLSLVGRHHNGADDAWNIAKIADKVLS